METIGPYFRTLSQASFVRYGFAYSALLENWAAIVGSDLAAICFPERIRWPRRSSESKESRAVEQSPERGVEPNIKRGGLMILRALPGRALELHYAQPQFVARINQFYGYEAISDIKIRQDPNLVAAQPSRKVLPESTQCEQFSEELLAKLAMIEDEGLRSALIRLHRAMRAESIELSA